MEYEVIRKVSIEQLERINKEYNRSFDSENLMIVKANGVEIGFGTVFFICGRLTLEYYLFKEFQHQGYGSMFVSILSDAIGEKYLLYSSLYLTIHKDNMPSMNVALRCGYSLDSSDWDFRCMIHDEMPDYYLYSKSNKYYKERKLKKVPLNQV